MKVNRFIVLCLVIALFSACKQKHPQEHIKTLTHTQILTETLSRNIANPDEHMVMAVMYQQTAAEYRALCYQAYNLARFMLDRDLENKKVNMPRCVVLDIDETVLDNSPYEAKCILEKLVYPDKWSEWIKKASAKPVPGALDFIKYARANGVEIYYVTNRKEEERESTIENLKSAGFSTIDDDHLLMRSETGSKEARRAKIRETRHISLLFGDSMADFSDAFDGKLTVQNRFNAVEKLKKEFGTRFIVLPNPMYGDWEGAVYDGDYKLADSVKRIKRYNSLSGF
ncbi:MAG: 5'-nucleotidase, lipoprotein e(P4) family [Bacteroidota bacterium]|nr:5'-nucleotidase, lipoprotein e(P4) family [Bacteroidota bacterium]